MNRKLPQVINQEEFEKIFLIETNKKYKLAFLLGFEAGMRISEIVGYKDKVPPLTKDRVDDTSIRIISGKGGKDRIVPRPKRMNKNALKLLPLKVSRRALQWEFKRLGKKVLGKDLHFHTLRHGFCSHLVAMGRPLHEIQMLAGHSRLDSIPDYTPIMIRKNGIIDVCSIEDLWNKVDTSESNFDGSYNKEIKNIRIFNRNKNSSGGNCWSSIYAIYRHKYNSNLIKLNSAGGVIDISPNHSIISALGGHLLDAKNLKIGDKLCIPEKEKFSWKWGLRNAKDIGFIGSINLAWLYGFFSAEGSICKNNEVVFYNFDKELLNKCKSILENNFYSSIKITNGKNPRVFLTDRRVYNFFKDNFYTSQKLKRVPIFILNSHPKVRKAFLDGYNIGDGYHKDKIKFKSFTSNSQVLMEGLLFLIDTTTKQDYNLFIRNDKKTIVQAELCDNGKRKTDLREIKKINNISYNGWLYDLSTKDETFCCGVGNIKVHNTTGIYLHANPKKAVEGAREVF